ncbi:MAG: dTDP-4-dehydrorhamnose reductase [Treponema sp.]|jgi:dTDP-4-dehydrorhamnose reductase|nr:dTDP-4-dehydrorhamnose reductase [Treponema sp.]
MYWIIGNQGMLGQELSHLFGAEGIAYIGTDKEVDITKPETLVKQRQPFDWVINCAGYTAVDNAEDDKALCRKLNVDGPDNIAAFAQTSGAKMLHISTDYVFSGAHTTPYREEDPTDPIGVYGQTKRDGEQGVLKRNGFIIRTSWLYGQYGKNFVNTMLRLMNERDSVSVVHDQRGSPTYAHDLAAVIHTLTKTVDAGGAISPGIYHYTNEGGITWYDFAAEIFRLGRELRVLKRDCTIRPCATSEYPTKAVRPAYSVLDTSKIKRTLALTIPDWKISLKQYLTVRSGQ